MDEFEEAYMESSTKERLIEYLGQFNIKESRFVYPDKRTKFNNLLDAAVKLIDDHDPEDLSYFSGVADMLLNVIINSGELR